MAGRSWLKDPFSLIQVSVSEHLSFSVREKGRTNHCTGTNTGCWRLLEQQTRSKNANEQELLVGMLKGKTSAEAEGGEKEAKEADTSAGMGNQLVEQEADKKLEEFWDREEQQEVSVEEKSSPFETSTSSI
eukprot:3864384-Rhodomonas_salina.1